MLAGAVEALHLHWLQCIHQVLNEGAGRAVTPPIPSHPITPRNPTPPSIPRPSLLLPLLHLLIRGCQVMKFDLFILTLVDCIVSTVNRCRASTAALLPLLSKSQSAFCETIPLSSPPTVASVAAGVSLYRKVDPIAPSFIM